MDFNGKGFLGSAASSPSGVYGRDPSIIAIWLGDVVERSEFPQWRTTAVLGNYCAASGEFLVANLCNLNQQLYLHSHSTQRVRDFNCYSISITINDNKQKL
jgi:hypothetical protein